MTRHTSRIALFCLLLSSFAVSLQAQFSVQPVIVQLAPERSAQAAVLHVGNEAARDRQFRIYLGDFDQDETGDHSFLPLGGHSRSCAGRISVFPDAATLRAGEHQEVRVRVEPGADTCWSMVFVESAAEAANGVQVGQRIGVKVYGIPAATTPAGEVTSVAVAFDQQSYQALIEFRNDGEAPLRPEGRVEIRTLSGEVVVQTAVEAFSVLPGRTRWVTIPLEHALPAGRYLAVPILDFGGDYLAGGQAIFQVP